MFCEFLRAHCGLHFDEDSRFIVEKRLTRRIESLGVGTFAAYHYLLRNGDSAEAEMSEIVDILTTNETYFYREQNHLRALIHEIIPEMLVRRREIDKNATAKIGSMPPEHPAKMEMVPVGATVVRLQCRSLRIGRTRSPAGCRAH